MSLVAKRLEELGIALPRPAPPVADYVPFTRVGALLFVSGQLPLGPDGSIAPACIGRIGPRASLDAAREPAPLQDREQDREGDTSWLCAPPLWW
jgi:hypothetical protein